MSWKIYPPSDLSNDEYQADPAVSGSGLATIYNQSPAHFKYSVREESKALTFGIAAHSMLLESEQFDAEYVQDINPEQYLDALITAKDMQSWLKERGLKISGSKPELVERILEAEPDTHILDVIIRQHHEANQDKTIIPVADYAKVSAMRQVIMQDEQMSKMLAGGFAEYSLIGTLAGVDVKVRPDLLTSGGGIVQYKTTRNCHPEDFGRNANSYGYLLKAALEWECYTAAYGKEPAYYIFLAQEKEAPYVWKPYNLGSDALAIGRVQLDTALNVYSRCIKSNQWPGYGASIDSLMLPEWLKKQYNVE